MKIAGRASTPNALKARHSPDPFEFQDQLPQNVHLCLEHDQTRAIGVITRLHMPNPITSGPRRLLHETLPPVAKVASAIRKGKPFAFSVGANSGSVSQASLFTEFSVTVIVPAIAQCWLKRVDAPAVADGLGLSDIFAAHDAAARQYEPQRKVLGQWGLSIQDFSSASKALDRLQLRTVAERLGVSRDVLEDYAEGFNIQFTDANEVIARAISRFVSIGFM